MINDKDIKTTEKPITDEKAQASQEPPKQETPKQETPKEEPQQQEAPQASLKEVIAKQAIEEEASGSSSFTLRKILGGDILTAQIIRRQIWLVILIVFFVIIYISNRYNIQNDIIELDKLQKELQENSSVGMPSRYLKETMMRLMHCSSILRLSLTLIRTYSNKSDFIFGINRK